MNIPLLEVKNLETCFRSGKELFTAVNRISFTLDKGEVLGIVGESGSGKSVTSLSIMRLLSSSNSMVRGEVIYREEGREINLLALPEHEMRSYRGNKIAMIFQEPMTSLNPVYTCGSQVAEAIRLHQGVDKKTARLHTIELFKEVQLPRPEQMYDSFPHQLSGGQKQRVMIAMALSCNPEILIADEPTTALDVTVQATILELLRKLKADRHMSMIFISHDLGVIAEIADKVAVMYKGDIVEQEPVRVIFSNPQHPYTKGLLACRPPLDKSLKILPTVADFMKEGVAVGESVEDVLHRYSWPPDEKEERRKKLYNAAPLLRVEHLQTWFPVRKGILSKVTDHVKAVDDVSFEVYPGETLGLVGESGCGKTTLGRTIIRLIEPTGGSVIFEEKNLLELQSEEMRRMRKDIQIIFQDPYSSLNPRMTVGDAIIEPLQVHKIGSNTKERKNRVLELLERVGLSAGHYKRYPHEFSGGQRQRICIARALALNPKFIICDESVSALDVSVQAQVLNLLVELREQLNLTYIFISHDLSVVKFISDRMIVMNKGKIEEIGDPEEIYRNPKKEYTKRLIEAIPRGELIS